MGPKDLHSSPGLFGDTNYYDNSGNYVGSSREGLFGDTVFYDNAGHRTGYAREDLIGNQRILDKSGHETGYARKGLFEDYHYSQTDDTFHLFDCEDQIK